MDNSGEEAGISNDCITMMPIICCLSLKKQQPSENIRESQEIVIQNKFKK